MRTAYHEQLATLRNQLGDMCGLAADAMEHASNALLHADLALAEQVITDHDHIAEKWRARRGYRGQTAGASAAGGG